MTINTVQQYRNARLAIAQIKAGKWKPSNIVDDYGRPYMAYRGGMGMWISNGAFFLEIHRIDGVIYIGPDYFGPIWRHLVWWSGARKLRPKKPRKTPRKTPVIT